MRLVALPLPVLLALVAPAAPARAQQPTPTPSKPAEEKAGEVDLGQKKPAPASVLEEVTGTVARVDRQARRLDLTTAKGPISLALDRNTLVYTQAGLGTALDIAPGQPIRAGRNAAFVAYWVQIRPAPGAPPPAAPSTPAQGTGPGGGAGPSTAEGGGTAPPATPPSTTGPASPAPGGK